MHKSTPPCESSVAALPPQVPRRRANVGAVCCDSKPALTDSLVMMVDDEPINTEIVQAYLEDFGFTQFVTCSDSSRALAMVMVKQPDVLLLDLVMPKVNGFDILAVMKLEPSLKRIPVIMLTSSSDAETKLKALELGATDFLAKPVDPSELSLRLKNTLSAKLYQDELSNHSAMLEHQVRVRTAELAAAQQQVLQSLATAGEFRDQETGWHVVRVGRYSGILARELGATADWVERIEQAAPLHDVGKIGISDTIMLKPGRLDPSEYEAMKQHCIIGTQIILPKWRKKSLARSGDKLADVPEAPIMRMAAVIALTHHEKWDGSGYPAGLKGKEIPIEGRIVAVADVYDALCSSRPYKKAFSKEKCFAILEEGRGAHFDPRVLDAFFAAQHRIEETQRELSD